MSYGYAIWLLDFKHDDIHSNSFIWKGLELSTFLTHVIISFLTYLFAWIACAQQPWTFFIPMFLSTPISFVWYTGSAQSNHVFPFTGGYFVEWDLKYSIFIVTSLLWISQVLAFGYHIFQKSRNVLTSDADLFWMPRYNSIFLEQQLILNTKIATSELVSESNVSNVYRQNFSKNSFIFICSTMYHETEAEMRQMLESIDQIARAEIHRDRNHTFESHIFFDNAYSAGQINQWAIQLLSLLKVTLGIKEINQLKIITPYGIQFRYTVRGKMPFYIHLKDSSKVKNKKRWSQVMYMNYVLHRIKQSEQSEDKISEDKAFILTTDADIDFTSGSVLALLDILVRDERVGAVCARTHPTGTGPVVWYQIFDYAIGHWFQKAAEHVLGSVLCCPGCFSVFRVSALKKVLNLYSRNVENGFEFLTKDMGEDRWLCTLLIQAGFRLEYSALSQDRTHCPETFEEFYKQRRRWIPSTIANLTLLIKDHSSITSNNDSITILFILYQFLIVFSSLISPTTVILIIVTGVKTLDHSINDVALTIVLGIISVLYGAICIYATEKTQIAIAKFLTVVFSVLMAVVISGILTDVVDDVIRRDKNEHSHHFKFPVDISTVYIGVFAATFIMAGILHFNEFFCLFHFLWYLLCLPSGYLFLLIYSVCNINNRSWGTREGTSLDRKNNSGSWLDYFLKNWHDFLSFLRKCIGKKRRTEAAQSNPEETDAAKEQCDTFNPDLIPCSKLDIKVKEWLHSHKCDVSI